MTSEPKSMQDAEARRRIREDLGTTFVVEAAAGTGKTTALIGRIVHAVAAGGRLERMVAVTFTEKAAGEMKIRLRDELERARREADAETEPRFVAALAELELAYVGTIHGFCGEMLRERPVEAGIDPLFEVGSDDEVEALVTQTFDAWFGRALHDPPDGVARVLHMKRWGRDSGPRELLRSAVRELVEHRDFPTAWARPPFDRDARLLETLQALRDVGELAESHPDESDYLVQSLAKIAAFARDADARIEALDGRPVESREHAKRQTLDRLEADLRDFGRKSNRFWKWTGARKKPFGGESRDDVLQKRDEAFQVVRRYIEDAEMDLAAALQQELWPLVSEYERRKRAMGRLDFLDLLLETRELLRKRSDVRRRLQDRFTHIFVDEFQDTDPVQVEVLFLLAANDWRTEDWRKVQLKPGKLFVVGDPKQAVYRFRRADLAVYQHAKKSVLAAGGEVLELSTSFRAVPSLQRVVNHAFAPRMEGAPHQAHYVPLAPWRDEPGDRPSTVVVPIPRPYGDFGTDYFAGAVESSSAESICAFVHWLVTESGWTIGEGADARPIGWGDIAMLFTRLTTAWRDTTTPYVQGLAQRGVPHILHGGRTFYEREEIIASRQVCAAIEWPDDPLAVYSVLRGPFFGIDDATLLAYREVARERVAREHHAFHPFADRSAWELGEAERAVGDALDVLGELHLRRNRRPIADTVTSFLEATRGTATLSFWPSPRQTLANIDRFVEHARRMDGRGATSFRAFITWIDEQAERGASQESGIVRDGDEGVRMMTVHKAKGLEFPVVVLCDPTAKETRDEPSRHVDAERELWAMPLCYATPADVRIHQAEALAADLAERIRVTYVAATRASELLVLPAPGDGPMKDTWLNTLYAALYPTGDEAERKNQAPGCPAFEGDDTILDRPEKVLRFVNPTIVRPGLHRVAAGVEAVWWDPAALKLHGDGGAEMRRQVLLDPAGVGAAPSVERHAEWVESRRATLERASAPSEVVRTVSALSAELAPEGRGVAVLSTGAWNPSRPMGARFGTLVHAVLAEVPFDASRELVDAVTHAQAKLLGATAAERSAAIDAVVRAFGHPLLERAHRAAEHRREVPIFERLPDGTLVEGVVDLAFRETDAFGKDRWVVVDYKTDLDAVGASDTYVVQVETYARAIESATGVAAEGILLGV